MDTNSKEYIELIPEISYWIERVNGHEWMLNRRAVVVTASQHIEWFSSQNLSDEKLDELWMEATLRAQGK